MMRSACHRRTLAAGEVGKVEQCSCGSIHLTLGPLTLRLDPHALGALAELLDEAARARAPAEGPRAGRADVVLS